MVKCASCGKFLAANVGAKCSKCSASYHHTCVSLADNSAVGTKWQCPGCKTNLLTPKNTSKPTNIYHTPETEQNLTCLSGTLPMHGVGLQTELAQEIRSFRNELSAIRAEVRECRTEIADFKTALNMCNDNIISMDSRISALETKFEQKLPPNVDALEDTIAELKCQLNDREQESLLNDVEIAGVPEHRDESLMHIVKVLATKLGADIDERDIVHVERIGSTRRNLPDTSGTSVRAPVVHNPRRIAVRFARRTARDCVLRAARVRRGTTSTDAQISGPPQRVYVNERLTPGNRRLFFQARQTGQQQHWKYIWTKDGKILARREDGKQAERIRSEKDIDKVFGRT